jgi:hypothetical protein
VTASQTIGPLLSSVSLMLAAFGFFYNTQKDRIDEAASVDGIPDDPNAKTRAKKSAIKVQNVARLFGLVALVVWALLVPEMVGQVEDAFDPSLRLSDYSTPNIIFFVAANAWLAVALYLRTRVRAVQKRIDKLA